MVVAQGLRLVLSEESTPEAQLVEQLQAESGPALLVASDAAMVERWREQLQPWPEELEARVVWLGACAEEAAWHSYNDPRCNGSKPLQHWQPLYPNLQLQQVEIKLRQPLTELLAHWQQQTEGLVLVQGERGGAADVLAGLGASSAQVAHLELTGCGELSSAVMDELDQQLWEQGALQRRNAQLIWERNEEESFRRTVLNELDALLSRLADCDGRMERINTELDEILALIDSANNGEPTDT